jgi:Putative transmembrane protein (PGPGW)
VAALHAIVQDLMQPGVFIALGVFSVVAFLATVIIVPTALARMPADYFVRPSEAKRRHPLAVVLKNVAGVVVVLLGIAMLVLPGQGILTVLLGLGLVDFPGRRRFELLVITRPPVLRAINALRRRAQRAPLEIPTASQT